MSIFLVILRWPSLMLIISNDLFFDFMKICQNMWKKSNQELMYNWSFFFSCIQNRRGLWQGSCAQKAGPGPTLEWVIYVSCIKSPVISFWTSILCMYITKSPRSKYLDHANCVCIYMSISPSTVNLRRTLHGFRAFNSPWQWTNSPV